MSNGRLPGAIASHAGLRGDALKQAWADFLGRIPWEVFVTLTFDPKRVFDVDRELAMKEARWWCGEVSRLVRKPVAWVIAPERGHGGRWHAHVLLAGLPSMGIGRAPEAIWRQRNGYIDVDRVTDVDVAALYTTKAAALTGDIELSDTVARYRNCASTKLLVDLYDAAANEALSDS
jgi:hypothetical protein